MTIDMDLPFAEFAEKHLKTPQGSNSALIDRLAAAVEKWASSPEGIVEMEKANAEVAKTLRTLREERRIPREIMQMPLGPITL